MPVCFLVTVTVTFVAQNVPQTANCNLQTSPTVSVLSYLQTPTLPLPSPALLAPSPYHVQPSLSSSAKRQHCRARYQHNASAPVIVLWSLSVVAHTRLAFYFSFSFSISIFAPVSVSPPGLQFFAAGFCVFFRLFFPHISFALVSLFCFKGLVARVSDSCGRTDGEAHRLRY